MPLDHTASRSMTDSYALGERHLSHDLILPDDETSVSSSWRSDHEATPARCCGVGGPD
jgi:hypothetical protein